MSVRQALGGRHLLLTGVTGFVGKVLLERILAELPDTRVTALVRPCGRTSGRDRVHVLLAAHPAFAGVRGEGHRIRVWEGSLDDVGSAEDADLDVDAVVHLASRVDFEPTPTDALADNLVGSSRIADLAARTRGRRLIHVSTCYVAGLGSREVPETPVELPDADDEIARLEALCAAVSPADGRTLLQRRARERGFANGYTLTKALAEHRLGRRQDVAVTLVRPSVVEAAWDTPQRGHHEGFRTCAPLVGLAVRGLAGIPAHPELVLDLVPVDRVARGLLLATAHALTEGAAGQVWQLGTSDRNPLTMDRLCELVELAARVHGGAERGGPARGPRWLGVRPTGAPATMPGRLAGLIGGVAGHLGPWERSARRIARDLGRVQRAADLFAPFILETDHRFRCDRAREATARLPPDERGTFGFDVEHLDWQRWWLEAQYPGLQQHCFPAMRRAG